MAVDDGVEAVERGRDAEGSVEDLGALGKRSVQHALDGKARAYDTFEGDGVGAVGDHAREKGGEADEGGGEDGDAHGKADLARRVRPLRWDRLAAQPETVAPVAEAAAGEQQNDPEEYAGQSEHDDGLKVDGGEWVELEWAQFLWPEAENPRSSTRKPSQDGRVVRAVDGADRQVEDIRQGRVGRIALQQRAARFCVCDFFAHKKIVAISCAA